MAEMIGPGIIPGPIFLSAESPCDDFRADHGAMPKKTSRRNVSARPSKREAE
jgi:hypothetical protein